MTTNMKIVLAIFLPWLAAMICGRMLVGLLLLLLQCTLVGWIPAAIVAVLIVLHSDADKHPATMTATLQRGMAWFRR